jgi:AcrR family transcriptional regulator
MARSRPAAERGPTPLQRQLAGSSDTRRRTGLDAFLTARRTFLAAERVDMSALAERVGVNRVTLYRWVGSREQLLVEVIWSLAERTLENLRAEMDDEGGERIVQVITRFIDQVLKNPGMSRFLADEGELAMRILTWTDMGFQPRLIADCQVMLEQEFARGTLDLSPELHQDVAYTIVRIVESYVYLDRITGEEPDARRAERVLRLLLLR